LSGNLIKDCDNKAESFIIALKWCLNLDPQSVELQKAKDDERKAERKRQAEKAKVERTRKRAKEAAEKAAKLKEEAENLEKEKVTA
jgi:hypothetical protein